MGGPEEALVLLRASGKASWRWQCCAEKCHPRERQQLELSLGGTGGSSEEEWCISWGMCDAGVPRDEATQQGVQGYADLPVCGAQI